MEDFLERVTAAGYQPTGEARNISLRARRSWELQLHRIVPDSATGRCGWRRAGDRCPKLLALRWQDRAPMRRC